MMIQRSIDKRFTLLSLVRWNTVVNVRQIPTNNHHHSSRLYKQLFSTFIKEDGGKRRRMANVFSSLDSGLIAYDKGWAWQQVLLNRRLEYQRRFETDGTIFVDDTNNDGHDHILLLEHDPVYTLGRGADEENLTFLDKEPDGGIMIRKRLSRKSRGSESARLSIDKAQRPCLQESIETQVQRLHQNCSPVRAPNGASIYRVDRGGEVTFHGPGQLVVYPLLNLRNPPLKKDLHWYLRCVEDVIIETLKDYDIQGVRDEINTGVWVDKEKIAAVGVSSSRWITTHGLALNVDPDLSFFDTSVIIPCGIEGRGVTSIAKIMNQRGHDNIPNINDVANQMIQKMEHIFHISCIIPTTKIPV